jgi:enoyl-CoA hydratase/carnithine racemase
MTDAMADAMTDDVLFETRDCSTPRWRIGVAWLDRPAQLNALTLGMCSAMLAQFRAWASDESIACVVLAGKGDKGFCAGGDVAAVVRSIRAGGPQRFVLGDTFFEVEYQLDLLIHSYPKPFVSWAHGVNMGGGVGLSVGAADRIVSEGAKIAMPEIHIGLFPDVGGGWFLNRLPGDAGLLMAMTGAVINEADALFAGLADHAIEYRRQPAFIDRLADIDWDAMPAARRGQVRRLCRTFAAETPLALPASALRAHHDPIRDICLRPDPVEFVAGLKEAAAIEKWFGRPLDNLVAGSPTAAAVIFEHMRRCRPLGIRQVLEADLVVARQCQRHHDFPEGVRAVLIDKSRDAQWAPARLQDVPSSLVEAFFRPV